MSRNLHKHENRRNFDIAGIKGGKNDTVRWREERWLQY